MQFTIGSRALADAVSTASKAAASNGTVPMLSGVLVTAGDGVVTLQCTDASRSIRHEVPAAVEETGSTVLSARFLRSVAKGLPDAPATVSDHGGSVLIGCGRSRTRLNALDPRGFPGFPRVSPEESFEMGLDSLASVVEKVSRMAAKDRSRPVLMGVRLSVADGRMTAAATDSYRMAVAEADVGGGSLDAVVLASDLRDAISVMPGGRVTVGAARNQVALSSGGTTYVARRVEGRYPDHRRLFPQGGLATRAEIGREELRAALRRVHAVAHGGTACAVLSVGGDAIEVNGSADGVGEACESLAAACEGADGSIRLNVSFLLDAVESCADELTLEIGGPESPCVIRSAGDVGFACVLMPVRA